MSNVMPILVSFPAVVGRKKTNNGKKIGKFGQKSPI